MKVFLFFCVLGLSLCKSPPLFNYTYEVEFTETFIKKQGNFTSKGKLHYDPINNKERIDLETGQYDFFCSSVNGNTPTPCITLTTNDVRWMIFPEKSSCCFCCTAERGCGVLRPDWLKEGDYQGTASIDGVEYDKWHIHGSSTHDISYVTPEEEPIQRRLQEVGAVTFDYDISSLVKKDIPSSVFALPSYCHSDKPIKCPLTSVCTLAHPTIQIPEKQ